MRLLSFREHSRAELRNKLLPSLSPQAILLKSLERLLDHLEHRGYLNDQSFAYQRSFHLRKQKHWGNRRIVADLMNRGIDATMIRKTLRRLESETSEDECLQEVIQAWIKRFGAPCTPSSLQKLYQRCLQLGYLAGMIPQALEPFLSPLKGQE